MYYVYMYIFWIVLYTKEILSAPPKVFPPYVPEGNRSFEDFYSTYGLSEKEFKFVKRIVYKMKKDDAISQGMTVGRHCSQFNE